MRTLQTTLAAATLWTSLALAQAPAAPAPAAPAAKPAAAAAPAVPAAKPAAPAPAAKIVPSLKPDKEGYCQSTEFVSWSKDGSESAYAESFCKQPPPDQAYDTLYFMTRQGRVKRWIIGAESGATMKLETRAKLMFPEPFRKAGAKAPVTELTANAKIENGYLLVTFAPAKKDDKAPAPVSQEIKLPYADWAFDKQPSVGELFWSPDGGALAITVKAVRKEPAGGKLPVASVHFIDVIPMKTAAAAPGPGPQGGIPTFKMPAAPAAAAPPAAPPAKK